MYMHRLCASTFVKPAGRRPDICCEGQGNLLVLTVLTGICQLLHRCEPKLLKQTSTGYAEVRSTKLVFVSCGSPTPIDMQLFWSSPSYTCTFFLLIGHGQCSSPTMFLPLVSNHDDISVG